MSGLLCLREGVSQRKQVSESLISQLKIHSIYKFYTVHCPLPFRFAVALEQLSDSLQMLKNQIFPGKLTWPLSKEIVKETQQDYLKVCFWLIVGLLDTHLYNIS